MREEKWSRSRGNGTPTWHIDRDAAERSPMQGLTASSCHTYSVAALLLNRMVRWPASRRSSTSSNCRRRRDRAIV